MKIEFRKVPNSKKELFFKNDSATIKGIFHKITPSLVKVDAILEGTTSINCRRCNEEIVVELNEKLDFLLSDGFYKNKENDDIVIEIENGLIDFYELIQSELNSIKSDYYICKTCLEDSNEFEKEY